MHCIHELRLPNLHCMAHASPGEAHIRAFGGPKSLTEKIKNARSFIFFFFFSCQKSLPNIEKFIDGDDDGVGRRQQLEKGSGRQPQEAPLPPIRVGSRRRKKIRPCRRPDPRPPPHRVPRLPEPDPCRRRVHRPDPIRDLLQGRCLRPSPSPRFRSVTLRSPRLVDMI